MADGLTRTDMAFSPVPVTVSGTFPNNSTMRLFRITVNGYTFAVDANDTTTGTTSVVVDISSALRGTLMEGFKIANASPTTHASWTASAKMEYLSTSGVITTAAATIDPSSGTVYLGRLTERERNAGVQASSVAGTTTTPSSRRTIKNISASSATYTSQTNEPDYVTDDDGKRYVGFKLLNHYGGIDYVFALSLYSSSIGTAIDSFSRLETATYSIVSSLISTPKKGYRSFDMSSGACTKEWAEWWANEFLHARAVAIHMGGSWVPCVIKPKSDTTRITDQSKADALHVDFTVTLGLDG